MFADSLLIAPIIYVNTVLFRWPTCRIRLMWNTFYRLAKAETTIRQTWANACGGCNGYKGHLIEAIDPADTKLTRLYHPRLNVWTDHFSRNDVFTHLVGLTSTGRATIAALQLNRPALINLRTLLIAFGEHPPLVGLQELFAKT